MTLIYLRFLHFKNLSDTLTFSESVLGGAAFGHRAVSPWIASIGSTDGVSPFALMFGRKERIPLDHLLGLDDVEWEQNFVQNQVDLVSRAQEVVKERTQKLASRNKARVDAKISDNISNPSIGSTVFLKRMCI